MENKVIYETETQWNEKITYINPKFLRKYNKNNIRMWCIGIEEGEKHYHFWDYEILDGRDLTIELLYREMFRLRSLQSVFGNYYPKSKEIKKDLKTSKKLSKLINSIIKEQLKETKKWD